MKKKKGTTTNPTIILRTKEKIQLDKLDQVVTFIKL